MCVFVPLCVWLFHYCAYPNPDFISVCTITFPFVEYFWKIMQNDPLFHMNRVILTKYSQLTATQVAMIGKFGKRLIAISI